ncbi:MAG: sporulation protein YabP [Clostridia bacterium]|nr:sporulation protein YabP [Clostridia bacterium]
MEEKKLSSVAMQNIYLENREKLNISGVKDVLSFDDQMVILETELGLLTVKGENLRINKLSIDTLDVSIDGTINTLIYSDNASDKRVGKSGNFLSKLFK